MQNYFAWKLGTGTRRPINFQILNCFLSSVFYDIPISPLKLSLSDSEFFLNRVFNMVLINCLQVAGRLLEFFYRTHSYLSTLNTQQLPDFNTARSFLQFRGHPPLPCAFLSVQQLLQSRGDVLRSFQNMKVFP